MKVQDERVFLRHRRAIAVETIDNNHAHAVGFDARLDAVRELSRRKLCSVHLTQKKQPVSPKLAQVDAKGLGPPQKNAHFFIEKKNSNLLSSTHGRCRVLQNIDRFPDASGADDDRARSPIDAAPEEQIDFGYAAFHGLAGVIPSMF